MFTLVQSIDWWTYQKLRQKCSSSFVTIRLHGHPYSEDVHPLWSPSKKYWANQYKINQWWIKINGYTGIMDQYYGGYHDQYNGSVLGYNVQDQPMTWYSFLWKSSNYPIPSTVQSSYAYVVILGHPLFPDQNISVGQRYPNISQLQMINHDKSTIIFATIPPINIWTVPKIGGVPPNHHPLIDGIVQTINQPFWAMKTSKKKNML